MPLANMVSFISCQPGSVIDGVISQSEAQASDLWRYREGIAEAVTPYTPYLYDLSVRISEVPAYLDALDRHFLPDRRGVGRLRTGPAARRRWCGGRKPGLTFRAIRPGHLPLLR